MKMSKEKQLQILLNRLGKMNHLKLQYSFGDILRQLSEIGDPTELTEQECSTILNLIDRAWNTEPDTCTFYTVLYYPKSEDVSGEPLKYECQGDYELVDWFRRNGESMEVVKVIDSPYTREEVEQEQATVEDGERRYRDSILGEDD